VAHHGIQVIGVIFMLECSSYKDINIGMGICGEDDYETKVYVYAIDGLMIDTGAQIMEQDVIEFFKSNHIDQVVLTHNHEDHTGTAPWILKNTNVPVYLNEGAIPSANRPPVMDGYVTKMWGIRDTFDPKPLTDKIVTSSGKYTFEVIHAPGHKPQHDCFYERSQGWLFSGDLYLGTKQFVCYKDENMKQTIESIEKVLQLDFDTIFCAHAGVVENGKVRLEKRLKFLKDLQNQVNEMRSQGMDDRAIDAEIHPFNLTIQDISGGDWSSYNIIHTL